MIQDLYKQKKSLELSWEQEYNESGKYTLNMVEIDEKVKSIITQIKLEEARLDDLKIKIANSRPEVSVATQIKTTYSKFISDYSIACALFKSALYLKYYTIINLVQTSIVDGLKTTSYKLGGL